MTALCGGGTSNAKPGQEATLIYSSGLLVQVLEELALDWLAPLIPLVPLAPFILASFCSTDPPTVVNLTTAEANALLQADFTSADFSTGLSKLPAIFENAIWNYSCQCTSGSYTPPTITQPTGTTVVVQPGSPTSTSCNECLPPTNFLGGQPGQWQINPSASRSSVWGCNPLAGSNPTGFELLVDEYNAPSGTPFIQFVVRYNGPGLTQVSHTFNHSAGWTKIADIDTWPLGGYNGVIIDYSTDAEGGTTLANVALDIYCDGNIPGGKQQPCCPPDAATQGYLDSIMRMVTLIQRQTAPFAYVHGATHAGLSGNGQISIQGLLGVQVNPTTFPPVFGAESGDPDQLWLDSWINWGNGDGWTSREWLRSAPFVSIPALAGQYTRIGYTFAPGMVADIVELVREP